MKETFKRALSGLPRAYALARHGYKLLRFFWETLAAHPGAGNDLLCYLSAVLGLGRSLGRPVVLTIEPVNFCNLRCPVCETGAGVLERERGLMKAGDFNAILDRCGPDLRQVVFYFMGEPFLNREAYAMIRAAADRGLHVSSCTNGEMLDPARLVESGIAEIQFQIGGLTQKTHETYRVGADLGRCLSNLQETLRLRDLHRDRLAREPFPLRIALGFILMRHNEHEAGALADLARVLGVDDAQVISPCVRTVEQARELLPTDPRHRIYDEAALAEGRLALRRPMRRFCEWVYSTLTVTVNGDVVPCCRDPRGRQVVGNLLRQDLGEVWNGERFSALRRRISTQGADFSLCALCEGYGLPAPPRRSRHRRSVEGHGP